MRQYIDQFTDPADHLALDEALLMAAEAGESSEALRVWQFVEPVVVAGRATRIDQEIDVAWCRARGIPVMRRCSGGASVIGGPGCLMYSVVLSLEQLGLRKIDVAHEHVMARVLQALRRQVPHARWQGTCDLTVDNLKCSGNSLRIARHHLLYHGTILHDFDLQLLATALKHPPRQPDYRTNRRHGDFVTNIALDPVQFEADLGEVFEVDQRAEAETMREWIRQLRRERYDDPAWHFRH